MDKVITNFVYNSLEQALEYSSYYSDLLREHKNIFSYNIFFDGTEYTLRFIICKNESIPRNIEGSSEGVGNESCSG